MSAINEGGATGCIESVVHKTVPSLDLLLSIEKHRAKELRDSLDAAEKELKELRIQVKKARLVCEWVMLDPDDGYAHAKAWLDKYREKRR